MFQSPCLGDHVLRVKYECLGDPVLRVKCEPVKAEEIPSPHIQQLIQQMKRTLGEILLLS